MSRKPSDATLLRAARAELRDARRQRDALKAEAYELRTRANKAEQELAEWKARFDKLLERSPVTQSKEVDDGQ